MKKFWKPLHSVPLESIEIAGHWVGTIAVTLRCDRLANGIFVWIKLALFADVISQHSYSAIR